MHIPKLAAILIVISLSSIASAVVVAYDDAAQSAYSAGGPYHSLNGGFGFTAWTHSLPAFPAGSGGPIHAYIASSTGNDPLGPPLTSIDTSGVAWGNNADPTGTTFLARRNLSSAAGIGVGGTFSISYDAGDVDGEEAIFWGLANNSICKFYFNPINPNYQFKDILTSANIVTPIPQTWGGLRLTFTRDSATTYSFDITRLSDNVTFPIVAGMPYDFTTITAIRTINISNNDGGAGGGHAMYVNAIEATAIPEPSSALALVAISATALTRRKK